MWHLLPSQPVLTELNWEILKKNGDPEIIERALKLVKKYFYTPQPPVLITLIEVECFGQVRFLIKKMDRFSRLVFPQRTVLMIRACNHTFNLYWWVLKNNPGLFLMFLNHDKCVFNLFELTNAQFSTEAPTIDPISIISESFFSLSPPNLGFLGSSS